MVNNISKYDYDIRANLIIKLGEIDELHKSQTEKNIDENLRSAENCNFNNNNNNNNNIDKTLDVNDKDNKLSSIVAACGEKILNPEFLLQGGGKLFTDGGDKKEGETSKAIITNGEKKKSYNVDNIKSTIDVKKEENATTSIPPQSSPPVPPKVLDDDDEYKIKQPDVTLYSQKMKGLRDIFLAEKLNTNAISLQITAQSQVSAKKSRTGVSGYGSEFDTTSRPKRVRRE